MAFFFFARPHRPRFPAPTRREASPFGVYCPDADNCLSRYTHQFAGLNRSGVASGSNSSLFYSLDIGLIHVVVLSYLHYLGLDTAAAAAQQKAWLAADLAAAAAPAQRARVPWILVCGHMPMYSAESGNSDGMIADLEPLFFAAGVDLHAAGHAHIYESDWPTGPNGAVASASFVAPRAPVHVTSGAGAAPAFGGEHHARRAAGADAPPPPAAPFLRRADFVWSYSRITAHNASHLTFEQIDNSNGTVFDSWTLVQPSHGPFAVGEAR